MSSPTLNLKTVQEGRQTTHHDPVHPEFDTTAFHHMRLPAHPRTHLVTAWLRAPAATAFHRVSATQVEEAGVSYELYGGSRKSWQDSFLGIDDRVKSLPYMVGPAHFQRYEVTNATLAKIDNWPSTFPLPLVLHAFDNLYEHPPSPAIEDLHKHHVEAFALLILDMGFAPATSGASCSAAQLESLTSWLTTHCKPATALFIDAYTHIYHNARTMSSTDEAWRAQLKAMHLAPRGTPWAKYLDNRHAPASALCGSEGTLFLASQRSIRRIYGPTFTDLYLRLHPHAEELLSNATSVNQTRRLASLGVAPSRFEPGARSSRVAVLGRF